VREAMSKTIVTLRATQALTEVRQWIDTHAPGTRHQGFPILDENGHLVGIIGYFAPRTLGVGYNNISDIISNNLTLTAVAVLCVMKFVSWAIALGSGTSGGTLAPLFTIGSGMGALLGFAATYVVPASAVVDVRIAALVGMAAIFAGASRAMLASAVFAFETTLQPFGLLPLFGGCTAAFLVSCLLMRNTIMTEKIARRGVRVPAEYSPDFLDQVLVETMMSGPVVTLKGDQVLGEVRRWMASAVAGTRHQGFPVLSAEGALLGVATRRGLLDTANPDEMRVADLVRRPPVIVYADNTLRAAADHMVNHDIGRLPVLRREGNGQVVGIITRSDQLRAHRKRLAAASPS
jgi:CBS domain-containing protein